ncbi:hypothetical protein OY671_012794, partial [Metschnikowia pulcherrima]
LRWIRHRDRQRGADGRPCRPVAARRGPERGGRRSPVPGRSVIPAVDGRGPPTGHRGRQQRHHPAERRALAGTGGPADRVAIEVDPARTRRFHQYPGRRRRAVRRTPGLPVWQRGRQQHPGRVQGVARAPQWRRRAGGPDRTRGRPR